MAHHRPGSGDDVCNAVSCDCSSDANAAWTKRCKRKLRIKAPVFPLIALTCGPACVGVGAGDDVRHAVAVDVAGRYEDTPAKLEANVKTIRDVADERVSGPVEDPDARPTAGPAAVMISARPSGEVCGRHATPPRKTGS